MVETLTGFKYIGEKIRFFENDGSHKFLFGFEESYGCLIGTYARDKDAVSAVMALCEAAAFYMDNGKTICDQMTSLYRKYGFYKERLHTVTMKGADGEEKIKRIMNRIRENIPKEIGGFHVTSFRDYKNNKVVNLSTGKVCVTGLPESDVLYFDMANDMWCCVRPSGTEPKIKLYMGVRGTSDIDADQQMSCLEEGFTELLIK